MKKNKIFPYLFDLQLFADGGAGSGASGASDGAAGSSPAAGQIGETGVQTGDAGSNAVAETADRAEKYKQFKKDFKQEFDSEVQGILRGRMKKASAFEQKVSGLTQMLAEKYGGDAKDVDALIKAVEEDDSFFEEAAMKKGLSVEQYKEFMRLERENQAFKNAAAENERRQQADDIYARWQDQSQDTKKVYPNFNLETEIENPAFTKLIRSGVDVKTAYEVVHKDEIIPAAMQLASQKTAQKIGNAVAANARRPSENGLHNQSSAITYIDPSRLTKEQMDEYKKRAARGEKITFRDNNF